MCQQPSAHNQSNKYIHFNSIFFFHYKYRTWIWFIFLKKTYRNIHKMQTINLINLKLFSEFVFETVSIDSNCVMKKLFIIVWRKQKLFFSYKAYVRPSWYVLLSVRVCTNVRCVFCMFF